MLLNVTPSFDVSTMSFSDGEGLKCLEGNAHWFTLGRDALYFGVEALGLTEGDVVLMPASMCDAVLHPLLSRGIKVIYYNVNKQLRYDLHEIQRLISQNVKALYITHYFGFPQDLNAVRRFCDQNNLLLIEDCAHALLGQADGHKIGSIGDIAIFSFRKFLPVWEGGLLVINNDSIHLNHSDRQENPLDIKSLIKTVLKSLRNKMKFIHREESYPHWVNKIDTNYQFDFYEPSHFLKKYIAYFDEILIANTRRSNFQKYLSILKDYKSVKTIYQELPDGVVPYSFPILVDRQEEVYSRMSKFGVILEPTHNYTYTSDELVSAKTDFPDVDFIAKQLLSLPVHQGIQSQDIQIVVNALSRCLV